MDGKRVFSATIIVLVTLAAAYLLYQIGQIILVLFVAIIFSSTIRPLVEALARRRIPRAVTVLTIYLLVLVALAGLLIVSVPPLIRMSAQLFSGDLFMEQVRGIASWLTFFGWDQFNIVVPVFTLPDQIMQLLNQAEDSARQQVWPLAQGTVLTTGQILLVFVMGFYWTMAREESLTLLLRVAPLAHRQQIQKIWNEVEETLGAYVRGQLFLMLAVGLSILVGLAVLGVPHAPALALIAALTEAIPLIGPLLGAIPALLIALSVSWQLALGVAIWYFIVQQLENHVLVPKVMEKAVGLNPLLVIVALLAGGMLNGIVGALLAIPVVGALQIIFQHLVLEDETQSRDVEDLTDLQEDDRALSRQEDESSPQAEPDRDYE